MARMINIGGEDADAFYRYKMPQVRLQVRKANTNGVHTAIANLDQVAKALRVPEAYLRKYLNYELNSEVKSRSQETVVKGAFHLDQLTSAINAFVKVLVLCPKCQLPELDLSTSSKHAKGSCRACGFEGRLDMSSKSARRLLKHMLKHAAVEPKRESKRDRKARKAKKQDKPSEAEDNEQANTPQKAEQWLTDASVEAQEARLREETLALKASCGTPSMEPCNFLQTTLSTHALAGPKERAAFVGAELRRLSLARGLSTMQQLEALLRALLSSANGAARATQSLKDAESLLRTFPPDLLLQAFGTVLDKFENLSLVPLLMELYDCDVVDEDQVLRWHGESSASIQERAQPFIAWLEEADEED